MLLLILSAEALSAISAVDSFEVKMNSLDSRGKIDEINRNFEDLFSRFPVKAREYALLAKDLSIELQDKQGLMSSYYNIALVQTNSGQNTEALENLERALALAREINSELYIGKCLNQIGIIYRYLSRYDNALENHKEAFDIFYRTNNNRELASSYINIGVIYRNFNDNEKSLEYFRTAYNICKDYGYIPEMVNALTKIGNSFWFSKELDSAHFYYKNALEICLKNGIKIERSGLLNNLGNVHRSKLEFDKAFEYYNNALKISRESEDKNIEVVIEKNIGITYKMMGKFDSSIVHLQIGMQLAKLIGMARFEADIYLVLSEVYELLKDDTKALFYMKQYRDLHDNIFDEQTAQRILEIKLQQERNFEKQRIEFDNQKDKVLIYTVGLIVISALLFVILLLMLKRFKQRLKTIEQLDEKNKFLSTLVNNIPNQIFYINSDLKITGTNLEFDKLFKDKYKGSAEIGQSVFECSYLGQLFSDESCDVPYLGLITSREVTIDFGRDDKCDFIFLKAPFYDFNDEFAGWICVLNNISDRKKAEMWLKESEKRYRNLVENAFDAIYMIRNESFEYINPRFTDITGFDFASIAGSRELIGPLMPSDNRGANSTFETVIKNKKGEMLNVELSTVDISIDGEFSILGIMRDITQRKKAEAALAESEQKFRQLFDKMLNGFALNQTIYDNLNQPVDFEIVEANSAFVDIFGIPINEIKSQSIDVALGFKKDPIWFDLFKEVSEFGITRKLDNYRTTEGRYLDIVLYGIKRGQFATIIRDVTERRTAEEKVQLLNVELEGRVIERTSKLEEALEELRVANEEAAMSLIKQKELNELKSRFVSMVSHEYRTPLTIILTSTYLIEAYHKDGATEKFHKQLKRIQDSVQSMTQLLEDVMLIGKSEEGKMTYKPMHFNVVELCNKIISEAKTVDGDKHPVEFVYLREDFVVYSDRKLIHHILSNLISNAMKYSPAESPVKVVLDENNTSILFTVIDKGIGIPIDSQSMLFEPFTRSKNVGTIHGTGLGLSIVKQCVDTIGGEITFTSQEDSGTTFVVTIPKR